MGKGLDAKGEGMERGPDGGGRGGPEARRPVAARATRSAGDPSGACLEAPQRGGRGGGAPGGRQRRRDSRGASGARRARCRRAHTADLRVQAQAT
jgi:hypothetical protein